MSYSNFFQLRMLSLLAITAAVVPLDLLEPRNFQRWVIIPMFRRVVPVPISGTADVRKVLLGTDGPANKPRSSAQGPNVASKTLVPLVTLTSERNALPSSSRRIIVTDEKRCVASTARLSAYVGLPPQSSEQLDGWHVAIQEIIMSTTAPRTCVRSGGNYFWKWCAHCLLDLVCCPVSKVLTFLQGLMNDAKSLSTLKVCGRHFGPSYHRGWHLVLSS